MVDSAAKDDLHWEIFSLIERDGAFFGSGWIFHEEKRIQSLVLKVSLVNGTAQMIHASFSKLRNDVAARFPKCIAAKHSGFFVLGSAKYELYELSGVHLEVTFDDGRLSVLPIPKGRFQMLGNRSAATSQASLGQIGSLLRRSAYLVKHFQIATLLSKASRYFASRPTASVAAAKAVWSRLEKDERSNIVVVVDHDMGGGANQYRERMVAKKIDEGATVIVLTYFVATLSYGILLRTRRVNERYAIPAYDFVLDLAEQLAVREVIYNTGVSFSDPDKIPGLLLDLRAKSHSKLTLLVHDFFMVCPSHYLLDYTGKYCDVPDVGQCQRCLVKNNQDYCSMYHARDVTAWRALWGPVIDVADELRFFSNSSLRLMKKAYPGLDSSRTVVKPHTGNYVNKGEIVPSHISSLRIGVVGQIGFHKGARIIQQLAEEISARKLDIRSVVIGTVEAPLDSSAAEETGPYRHSDLAAMIVKSGANIMLFPSIWPETFSYVVLELMEMNLPVACYDLGAPAERVATYAKGLILQPGEASATLDDLLKFHKKIYRDF
ncbi:MAG: glycosyltransferase [Gallionella sp.]